MTTLRPMRLAAIVVLIAAMAGCSMFSGKQEVTLENMPPDQIFQKADAELAAGSATQAAKTYSEIDRLYPFSQLAKRAIIMSAFASYKARDFSSARASAQRYLDLYPSDEDAAYAQHLIALSYYDNIVDVGRDQGTTEQALQALREVVNRYPDSEYARDAQLKIDLTLDHLAGKEMEIGRYYLKRGYYAAAINRFRVVVDKYQTTSQVPEALHRIVEANLALGLDGEAKKAAAVLGHNYPGSVWYADSYELITGEKVAGADQNNQDDGFFSQVYRRVIKGKWL
jgi:outer membrane protein assembly factor BamD